MVAFFVTFVIEIGGAESEPATSRLALGIASIFRIGLRIEAGQVVMQFSDQVEWVRMSSAGARKLAAMLIKKANEQDRLASEGESP